MLESRSRASRDWSVKWTSGNHDACAIKRHAGHSPTPAARCLSTHRNSKRDRRLNCTAARRPHIWQQGRSSSNPRNTIGDCLIPCRSSQSNLFASQRAWLSLNASATRRTSTCACDLSATAAPASFCSTRNASVNGLSSSASPCENGGSSSTAAPQRSPPKALAWRWHTRCSRPKKGQPLVTMIIVWKWLRRPKPALRPSSCVTTRCPAADEARASKSSNLSMY
mmetsp:Transcript_94615/g.267112  ORF Transcript_94615/g.267112 Transcript_94615/m.267112 type:complete len:224 (+) Transcript_94615:193-864(+)